MKKIIIAGIITLSFLIYLDVTVIDKNVNTNPLTDHTDNLLYIERAKTIINGGLLYRDVVTKTPPLINYLLIPPVYFGASPVAFEIYFSFFIMLTAVSIYYFLSSINKKLAYKSSFLFLFIPTVLATSTFCRQDESITVFFFTFPLLLLYGREKKFLYSIFSSIGIWIKMHPIFLVPPFLIKQGKKEILKHVLIIVAISLAIIMPFLIFAFDEFIWFIKFYFFGKGEELQGISLWRIMDAIGFSIPSIFLIALFFVFLIATYVKFRKNSVWKMVLISLIGYFILYPKIHYEYYIILFAVALPYLAENKRDVIMIYAISVLTSITLLIEQRYLDWKTTDYAYWLFISIAIACMIIVNAIFIYLLFHISKKDSWLDKRQFNISKNNTNLQGP